jgi:hypothetical protein
MFLKAPKVHENPSNGPHDVYANAPKITGQYDELPWFATLDTHEKRF